MVLLFPTWNRILEIDEANLAVWVEPGVVTGQLHAAAGARGRAPEPSPEMRTVRAKPPEGQVLSIALNFKHRKLFHGDFEVVCLYCASKFWK